MGQYDLHIMISGFQEWHTPRINVPRNRKKKLLISQTLSCNAYSFILLNSMRRDMASCCWCQKGVSKIFGATFLTITTDRGHWLNYFYLTRLIFCKVGYYLYFGSRSLPLFRFCFYISEHLKDLKSFKLKTSTMGSDQRPGLIHSLKVPIRLAILFYTQDKQISSGLEITSLVFKFIKLYSFFFLLTNLKFKQIFAGKSVCSMLNLLCMLWNIKVSIYKLGVGHVPVF